METLLKRSRLQTMLAISSLAARRVLLFALLGSAILFTACASPPPSTAASDAEAAYRRGDFETAERLAQQAERDSQGLAREEAAYLAGLSAAKQGDLETASRSLRIAAASSDRDLAARANASLGSVEQARGEQAASRAAFRQAAASPDPSVADRADRLSGGGSTASATASPTSGFAVQAGAFSTQEAARQCAASLADTTRRAGLGEPRVVPIRDRNGRTLWAVQIGSFPDRRQAGSMRDRLGHPEWAIEAIGSR
jgi:tetratricopeptide (TPR) repeat protein